MDGMDKTLRRDVVRRRRWQQAARIGGAVLLLAVAVTSLSSWVRPTIRSDRLRTARVERGRIEAVLEASGVARPASELVISSPLEARVLEVLKRPGDVVGPGEAIVVLDGAATVLAIDRLEERLAGQRNDASEARLALERTLAETARRRASLTLDLELAEHKLAQQKRLRSEGLVSDDDLRAVEVAARKARIEVEALAPEEAQARAQGEIRQRTIALAAGILGKEIAGARADLKLATASSVSAGVVTWVASELGATVRRGDAVARIADLSRFRIEATLSDVHAGAVSEGLEARVVAGSATLAGRVGTVHPAIENGTLRFIVVLDAPGHPSLRNNLRVDVRVVTAAREGVLKVQRGSRATGAVAKVFVLNGDRAVRREVRFGLAGYGEDEVTAGLALGDLVIVSELAGYEHLSEVAVR